MKSVAALFSLLLLVATGFFVFASGLGWLGSGEYSNAAASQNFAGYQEFINLTSPDLAVVDEAISNIDNGWHPGAPVMLLESARFSATMPAFERIFGLLKQKTHQTLGCQFDEWYEWIWRQQYGPHPEYAKFKGTLYSRVDPQFVEYFENANRTTIRLDEIQWGGVIRDGIPPLENPGMIPVKKATYLDDSNVVFGVVVNGDARCYPKRVLAWHEMFKDTIGGEPVCGAY